MSSDRQCVRVALAHALNLRAGVEVGTLKSVACCGLCATARSNSVSMANSIEIHGAADFHVHLRQGSLSKLVTPHVRKGGFGLAYVMVGPVLLLEQDFAPDLAG